MSGELGALEVRRAWQSGELKILYDGGGLEFKVTGVQAGSWVFRYQINGRRRPMGLGSYSELTLAAAREKREELRKLLGQNVDPLEERRAELSKAAAAIGEPHTCRDLFVAFMAHKSSKWQPRVLRHFRNRVERHVMPILEDILIPDISNALVHRVLDPIWLTKPRMGKVILEDLTALFKHAAFKGLLKGTPNPLPGMLTEDLPTQPEGGHFRHLPHERVPELMAKIRAFRGKSRHHVDVDRAAVIADYQAGLRGRALSRKYGLANNTAYSIGESGKAKLYYGPIIAARALEFLILSGPLRHGEVLKLQWGDVHWQERLIVIPRERMKTKRGRGGESHVIPMIGRKYDILREMEAIKFCDYVFPGSPMERAEGTASSVERRVRGAKGFPMGPEQLRVLLHKRLGYSDVDVHGFRATFVG